MVLFHVSEPHVSAFWLVLLFSLFQQTCTFAVDYTIEGKREFGSVYVGPQNENVAVSVVANGWATVSNAANFSFCKDMNVWWSQAEKMGHLLVQIRDKGNLQSPDYDQLAAAKEAAEAKGLGRWTKVKDWIPPRPPSRFWVCIAHCIASASVSHVCAGFL